MMVVGVSVAISFLSSVVWLTVSNAFDMSSATAIVRAGGFFWLMPEVIMLLIAWRAVVVECVSLKPC